MRIIELKIKKGADSPVSKVSFVENPAIEENFVKLAEEKPISVKFSEDEKRMVISPALIPNKFIYRQDVGGDEAYVYFSTDTVEEVAYMFLANKMNDAINLNHEDDVDEGAITLAESWVIMDSERDKSALYGYNLPVGTWMLSYHINDDELWNRIKAGEFKGLSIEALMDAVVQESFSKEPDIFDKIDNMLDEMLK